MSDFLVPDIEPQPFPLTLWEAAVILNAMATGFFPNRNTEEYEVFVRVVNRLSKFIDEHLPPES